jgi:hypothetical protein
VVFQQHRYPGSLGYEHVDAVRHWGCCVVSRTRPDNDSCCCQGSNGRRRICWRCEIPGTPLTEHSTQHSQARFEGEQPCTRAKSSCIKSLQGPLRDVLVELRLLLWYMPLEHVQFLLKNRFSVMEHRPLTLAHTAKPLENHSTGTPS